MKFYHPRIMVECAQDPEPTVDQMVDFCLAALGHKPAVGSDAGGVSRGATLHILAET